MTMTGVCTSQMATRLVSVRIKDNLTKTKHQTKISGKVTLDNMVAGDNQTAIPHPLYSQDSDVLFHSYKNKRVQTLH